MDADLKTNYDYRNEFLKDGVLVIRNKIKPNHLSALKNEIFRIRKIINNKITSMARPLKTYSDIAERQLGRLDFRCGFTANIFIEVGNPIIDLVRQISPHIDFRSYWGAIPSQGGAGPTDMHRDIYSFLNTTKGMNLDIFDLQLPPYYLTVLIPLVEITYENGPTQFIKGSHKKSVVNEVEEEIFMPFLSPSDIVIFDGRTMHKGSANNTKEERLIAYITFIAKWYNDQTFVINNYLFPELAVKE